MKPQTLQVQSLPAPVDGINRLVPPDQLPPTQARELVNFACFDSGIQNWSNFNEIISIGPQAIRTLFRFPLSNGSSVATFFWGTTIRKIDPIPTVTNITGAAVITAGTNYNAMLFSGFVYYLNGVNPMLRWDGVAATVVLAGWVGPAGADIELISGVGYKGRAYFIQQFSRGYWYGGLLAITGALTAVDVNGIFQTPGWLTGIATWTFNQGLTNEEYLVLVNTSGEILIYEGLFPGDPSWRLKARGQVPSVSATNPFTTIGSELYIVTARGLIPLSSVFTGAQNNQQYYVVSRNILDDILPTRNAVVSTTTPFLAVIAKNGRSMYALNYERGAWSQLIPENDIDPLGPSGPQSINTICFLGDNGLAYGTLDGKIFLCSFNAGGGPDSYTVWRTGFFSFDSTNQKHVKFVRVRAKSLQSGAPFTIRGGIEVDFKKPTRPFANGEPSDTQTSDTPALGDPPYTSEIMLNAGGTGRRVSFVVSDFELNGLKEIQGVDMFYEEGGVL